MKVRAGSTYVFDPVFLDLLHPCSKATRGQPVRVVNLPGCPKANTMGQCHVNDLDGAFLGMVSTSSLSKTASR